MSLSLQKYEKNAFEARKKDGLIQANRLYKQIISERKVIEKIEENNRRKQ